ncbi:MAG: aldose 1-epimerase family protein [Bacteroidia bacterium]
MNKYSINNETLQATFNAKGAELVSLIYKPTNFELIWQADKNVWPRHAPVLFPIVGKLKNDFIEINNQTYQISQHGFARDMDFELQEIYTDKISFILETTPATLKKWPFEFKLIITYSLLYNSIKTTYTVINADNEKMPHSIGGHPGFNLPVNNLKEFEILLSSNNLDVYSFLLNNGLVTDDKLLIAPKGKITLHNEVFKNDALVFKNINFDSLELKHTNSNFAIEQTFKGFNYYGIWNKYPSQQFICLEPWAGITDNIKSSNRIMEKEGLNWLEPGESKMFEFTTAFKF